VLQPARFATVFVILVICAIFGEDVMKYRGIPVSWYFCDGMLIPRISGGLLVAGCCSSVVASWNAAIQATLKPAELAERLL